MNAITPFTDGFRKSVTLAAQACLAFAFASSAQATNYFWNNSTGGLFTAPLNWTPFVPLTGLIGPGGAADTVNFNLGVTPGNRYAITNVNGQNDRLLVRNDSLSLAIGNYSILNPSANDSSFVVGLTSGDHGNVTLLGSPNTVLSAKATSIGRAAGSSGTVTVDGLNWNNSFSLFVGRSGAGLLLIRNGSVVTNTSGFIGEDIGSTGTVTVDSGSTWNNSSFLEVGSFGTGTLTIQGGSATNTFAKIGNRASAVGEAVITGSSSTWTNSGELAIGEIGRGSLSILGGGQVSSSFGVVGKVAGSNGTVIVNGAGSKWTIGQRLSLGGNASTGANGGTAALNINSDGVVDVAQDTVLFPSSTLRLQGGMLATDAIQFQGGGQFLWTAGTLHIGTFDGDLTNSAGKLAPGRSAGSTVVLGNYTQQAAASLEIEIGGLVAGSTHDLVNISGAAVLGGQLQLNLINGFLPSSADTFTVLNAADGLFSLFNNVATGQRLTTTDGIGSFLVHYGLGSPFNQNQIILTDFQLAGLPGDFNLDGTVDAADYILWRKTGGTQDGYNTWRANFGSSLSGTASPTGVAGNSAVPEPSSIALWLLATGGLLVGRRNLIGAEICQMIGVTHEVSCPL